MVNAAATKTDLTNGLKNKQGNVMPGKQGVTTIGICSGKGGVGKTNVAVNLATALGAAGNRVLLLDADLGLANVNMLLGFSPVATLEQVLRGECSLDDIVVDGPPGVKVIPASSGVANMANLSAQEQAALIACFATSELEPDYLMVDIGAGIHPTVLNFCSAVQHVVVVVCDEPASVADAYALIKVLSKQGVKRFSVLANMVKSDKRGYEVYHQLLAATDKFLTVAVTYLGAIPFDESLKRAVQKRSPVVRAYPESKAAQVFRDLEERLSQTLMPRLITGRIEFFIESLASPPVGANQGANRPYEPAVAVNH